MDESDRGARGASGGEGDDVSADSETGTGRAGTGTLDCTRPAMMKIIIVLGSVAVVGLVVLVVGYVSEYLRPYRKIEMRRSKQEHARKAGAQCLRKAQYISYGK